MTIALTNRPNTTFSIHIDVAARTIHVRGCLDMSTVGKLFDAVAILTRHALDAITVDLGSLVFIDATGLGALVRLRNNLAAFDKTLTLEGVRPDIARVFALGKLDSLL